jgi:hypothetical protein
MVFTFSKENREYLLNSIYRASEICNYIPRYIIKNVTVNNKDLTPFTPFSTLSTPPARYQYHGGYDQH